MIKAYRVLRENSRQTRWGCVKFQLWIWWTDLKWWPRLAYRRWLMKRLIRKNPKAVQEALDELCKLLDDD